MSIFKSTYFCLKKLAEKLFRVYNNFLEGQKFVATEKKYFSDLKETKILSEQFC